MGKNNSQIYKEVRDLSEAIGRTTVEDATVSDSGRVQEFIQGRHLITPNELISLNKEVIVFTADTAPLRLPLIEPLAYEQALSYDPPFREKHQVSDFVKRRGRTEEEQRADRENSTKPKPQHQQGKRPQQQSKPDSRSDLEHVWHNVATSFEQMFAKHDDPKPNVQNDYSTNTSTYQPAKAPPDSSAMLPP